MSTHYLVTVVGQTWEGFTSSLRKQFKELPPSIKFEFGDFESIADYQIDRVDARFARSVDGKEHTVTVKTTNIQGWGNADCALIAEDMHGEVH